MTGVQTCALPISANAMDWLDKPFLALHISGGTTELLYIIGDEIKIIGKTLDISAGQLIDRVGVRLGLKFPCGKALEELADGKTDEISLPVSVKGTDINFSGAEARAMQLSATPENIAAAVMDCVAATIERVIENAKNEYATERVLIVGGVAANKQIRKRIENNALFASAALSSDNAVGTALLGMNKGESL